MSNDITGWRVWRSCQFYQSDPVAVDEYLGFIPNDGQPGDPVTRAVNQYDDLRRQIDGIEEPL